MAKISLEDVANYLEKLKTIYLTVDESKFENEVIEINEAIDLINSMDGSMGGIKDPTTVSTAVKKRTRSKPNSFESSLAMLYEKKYDELKGIKINYKEVRTSVDAIEFFEIHTDSHILRNTTALDLKLLYCILTEEDAELKDKNKGDLLKSIRRNIRAGKRGEAFTKTI